MQSASGAICYSAEPVDGVLGGGIELIGHGKQAGEEANAASGDALALGAEDAADGSVQNIRLAAGRCNGVSNWPDRAGGCHGTPTPMPNGSCSLRSLRSATGC